MNSTLGVSCLRGCPLPSISHHATSNCPFSRSDESSKLDARSATGASHLKYICYLSHFSAAPAAGSCSSHFHASSAL